MPFESLYVHVPFCVGKCGYCIFYSVARSTSSQVTDYLNTVQLELTARQAELQDLQTIFVGGGTPSALEPRELRQLLKIVQGCTRTRRDLEFTVECNPDSLNHEKISLLAQAGVNRLSLGVQTFIPRLRKTLGRSGEIHQLPDLLDTLRKCGIHNCSMDLIYAIPGQTLEDWKTDLQRGVDLGFSHVSTYALTIEEGSRLAAQQQVALDESLSADMWERTEEWVEPAGIKRYEVSNLAASGRECRHNDLAWHGGTYLGCGPAACSFDGRMRWANRADLRQWLNRLPPELDALPRDQRAREILAFGLRTVRGWTAAEFVRRTGKNYMQLCGDTLNQLAEEDLLKITQNTLRPTRRGLLFADYVAEEIL